ncbi:UDP-N-acetyl-D-glucosamine 6-dehydrogenase [compost metagenome]
MSAAQDKAKLIRVAREVNDSKPGWVIEKVKLAVADYLQANPNKTAKDVAIACFGLAFKPNIDDLRESPSLDIARQLGKSHPGAVWAVEPNIDALPLDEPFELVDTVTGLEGANILVLLVDHAQFKTFKSFDFGARAVIDTRGLWC